MRALRMLPLLVLLAACGHGHSAKVSGGGTATDHAISASVSSGLGTPGTISLNPGGSSYPAGTSVTVTATPNSGWAVDSWTIDGTVTPVSPLTHNPVSCVVVMDADHTMVAHFTPLGPG